MPSKIAFFCLKQHIVYHFWAIDIWSGRFLIWASRHSSFSCCFQTHSFRNHSSSFVEEFRKQRPIGGFLFQQFLFFLVKHFFCILKLFFYFGLVLWIHIAIHSLWNSENFVKENFLWLGFSYTCLAEFFFTVALELTDTPQMGCYWKLCFPGTELLLFSVCDETFSYS